MSTVQMTARRGSLQRSSSCPKPKSYSTTQVLRSHYEVSLPSYPSRLPRGRKGICDKESSGMVGTTPWADQHCHHPTWRHIHCFWAWVCAQFSGKKFWKNFYKILARILERVLQDSWQDCLIIHPCKILAKFLQGLSKNIAEFFQDPCKILQ